MRKTIKIIVSSGQYETSATIVKVTYTTLRGLLTRMEQLQRQYAIYGDNWAGWIKAKVAIASDSDQWGDNDIIGGQWCVPANGWICSDPDKVDGPGWCFASDIARIIGDVR